MIARPRRYERVRMAGGADEQAGRRRRCGGPADRWSWPVPDRRAGRPRPRRRRRCGSGPAVPVDAIAPRQCRFSASPFGDRRCAIHSGPRSPPARRRHPRQWSRARRGTGTPRTAKKGARRPADPRARIIFAVRRRRPRGRARTAVTAAGVAPRDDAADRRPRPTPVSRDAPRRLA